MPPQLEKTHVVPTAWQDEALARDAGGGARVTAGPKRPHLSVCPGPNFPLQGRQGSRGCIPGSPAQAVAWPPRLNAGRRESGSQSSTFCLCFWGSSSYSAQAPCTAPGSYEKPYQSKELNSGHLSLPLRLEKNQLTGFRPLVPVSHHPGCWQRML